MPLFNFKDKRKKPSLAGRLFFYSFDASNRNCFHCGFMKDENKPQKPDLVGRNADLEIKQEQASVSLFSALPHLVVCSAVAALGGYLNSSLPSKMSFSLPEPFSHMFKSEVSFGTEYISMLGMALMVAALVWGVYSVLKVLLQKIEANGRRVVYSHGVFNRTEDMMEIFSIHQVDVTRNLFELIFGMATLNVELKREGWVKLKNLKNKEAKQMKKFIWAVARDSYVEHAYLRDRDRR